MIGEVVEHVRFGRGFVTEFEPPRIGVRFDSDAAVRRFSYPAACKRFLTFESPAAAKRARRDLDAASADSLQADLEKIEQSRRRQEALNESRLEQMRQKRTDAARKAAERRKMALAARAKGNRE